MPEKKKKQENTEIEAAPEGEMEETELIEEEANAEDRIKKLRSELKACREERQKTLDDLQRAKAEYLNARKRIEGERARDIERAENAFIERLLPLCDSFHSAMSDEKMWQSVDESWRRGVERISEQLQTLLASYGVTVLDPTGSHFDPKRHEAVSTSEAANGVPPDTVTEVVQLGYERGGTLIRPAKVIISK